MKDVCEMYRKQLKENFDEEMKLIEAFEEISKTPKGLFMRMKLCFVIADRVASLYRVKQTYINTCAELKKLNLAQQQ